MKNLFKKGTDFVGISVVFFCHDGKGRCVIAKRGNDARDEHGKWDIGAGSVEFGNTIEDTLHREIKEEYCTDIIDFEFLGYRSVIRGHSAGKTHWVTLDFKVLVNPEMVKNGEPHKFTKVDWFTVNTIPRDVHSQIPSFLKLYRNKLFN